MQVTDSIETHAHGTSKNLVSDKEEIKCNNIKKTIQKLINFDDVAKENINSNWPQILDHSYRILIIRDPGSGKANSLFNLINQQPDIDKIYLHFKDPYEAKYKLLIKKPEDIGAKHFNDFKAFNKYSNDMDDVYKNIEEYNPNKKCKILISFDYMIADMLSNKKLNPIIAELFIRSRKLSISLVFITQYYFAFPKNIRLNSAHYFIMKIPNKRELQQIAFTNSSDINFKDFMNLYKKCT